MANDRSYLKTLPDLNIENYSSETWLENPREPIDARTANERLLVYKIEQIVKQNNLKNESQNRIVNNFIEFRDAEVEKIASQNPILDSEYIIKKLPGIDSFGKYNPNSNRNSNFYDYEKILREKYSAEKINTACDYVLCNKVSEKEGFSPAYKVQNAGANTFATEEEYFLANFDKIVCDLSANGYRFPTKTDRENLKRFKTMFDLGSAGKFNYLDGNGYIVRYVIKDGKSQHRLNFVRIE